MKRLFAITLSIFLAFSCTMPAFAGGDITLDISKDNISHEVSPMLYGISLDDDVLASDGGLGSNLVGNNSFELKGDNENGWIFSDLSAKVEKADSMNSANPHYAKIKVDGQGYATNLGYTERYDDNGDYDISLGAQVNMGFKKGESYEFSCFLKNIDFEGSVSVYLDSSKNRGNALQLSLNNLNTGSWKRFSTKLKSVEDANGGLVVAFKGKGTICMDYVSLCSLSSYGNNQEQWKYTTLRADLVDAIKNLKPSFIRFSAGYNQAKTAAQLASWKDTTGALEERSQYTIDVKGGSVINTSQVGYHEYFQLCEELYAEPVPVVNAGMICQDSQFELMSEAYDKLYMDEEQYFAYLENEKGFSSHDKSGMQERSDYIDSLGIKSVDDWDNYIKSIALIPNTDDFSNYAQDVLDLIEYANGDANSSYWGSIRKQNGHAEPFDMKYIAIGNNNWGEIYYRNFKALKGIINKKYPNITVICSTKNGFDGEALDQTWSNISASSRDAIVGEHYSTKEDMLLNSNNRYDSYDRASAGVMIDGYSSQTLSNPNCLYSAVEEACFMTGVERNGDIVKMSAYAPTLSRLNASTNISSLIWFDSQKVVLTPNYYTRLLFANNFGTEYVNASLNGVSDENLYQSTTVDTSSQVAYIKIANADSSSRSIRINFNGFDTVNYVSCYKLDGSKNNYNEADKQTIAPKEKALKIKDNSFVYEADGYSACVIRVAYGSNKGKGLYTIPDSIDLEVNGMTMSDALKLMLVVVPVFLLSSGVGYFAYTRLVLKKQGKEYKLNLKRKKKDEDEE